MQHILKVEKPRVQTYLKSKLELKDTYIYIYICMFKFFKTLFDQKVNAYNALIQ